MSKLEHVQQIRFTDAQRRFLQKQGGTMAEAVRALIDRAAIMSCPTCKGTGVYAGRPTTVDDEYSTNPPGH